MMFNIWRYAVLSIRCQLPGTLHSLHLGDVEVRPTGPGISEENGGRTTFLYSAFRPYEGQLSCDGSEVVLAAELYRPLQKALEAFANLLAIEYRCSRRIMSPGVYAAVEPLDDEGRSWLSNKSGVKHEMINYPFRMYPHFDSDKHWQLLSDRIDGVELLAESLCHNHSTGKLHDLMRVFERAFRSGPTKVCTQLLPVFLDKTDYGFSESEVRQWLLLRDTSVHADQRLEFATEADTSRVITRVEQAAFDVLFNKREWRTPSVDRREVFKPSFAAADPYGNRSILYKGGVLSMEFSPLDGFGAYPLCLRNVSPTIPDGWICTGKPFKQEGRGGPLGVMEVRPMPEDW